MSPVSSQRLPSPDQARYPGAAPSVADSWLLVRGQATEKLCVHLPLALRDRLDRARRALRRYPGAEVLRSRNVLIAYACHRLRVDLDTHGVRGDTAPDPAGPAMTPPPVAADTARGRIPEWLAMAALYRVPWENNLVEPRCQQTLRLPPSFAARLRELHAQLAATPRHARRPELVGVHTFSDLVGLACHELCRQIEADTTRRRPS